mmetsp:Transcript_19878/g.19499  ORF Transcript_19878/g.19499 Transcript_19878/m.19499 type:complete len:172 (+) Transcript_19878:457-972(+)
MNFIVFLFLEKFDSNEERAFWLLVAMMKHLRWRKLYKLDTPKLITMLERLRKRLIKEVPEIYNHMVEQELPIEGVFAPFFLTLFLYSTPVHIALRIIDCFLYKGEDFLLELTVKMLKLQKEKILSFVSDCGPCFELQMYLSKNLVQECCENKTVKSILGRPEVPEVGIFNL